MLVVLGSIPGLVPAEARSGLLTSLPNAYLVARDVLQQGGYMRGMPWGLASYHTG
jgi:hypothetical protein